MGIGVLSVYKHSFQNLESRHVAGPQAEEREVAQRERGLDEPQFFAPTLAAPQNLMGRKELRLSTRRADGEAEVFVVATVTRTVLTRGLLVVPSHGQLTRAPQGPVHDGA